jgi:hypothetical protein
MRSIQLLKGKGVLAAEIMLFGLELASPVSKSGTSCVICM